ncbi:MAG: tetratricopeptide (TPR) repeat protein [Gammaproteobacteria bacterium]|jgi:tetratricopeptide (TPR) repeat protein
MTTTMKNDRCLSVLMLLASIMLVISTGSHAQSSHVSLALRGAPSMMLAAQEASGDAKGLTPVPSTEPVTAPTSASAASADEANPVDTDAIFKVLVAEFAGRRGQLPLALSNYLELARRISDPAIAERAVRIAVFARDQAGGLEAARLWAASAQPNHEARQVLGNLLMRADNIDEAITVLMGVVNELAPTDPKIFARVSSMLAREKSRTSSVTVMEALIAPHQSNAAAQFAFAQLLGRFGELQRASVVLDKVNTLDPAHERAAVFAAQILQRQKKLDLAVQKLGDFVERNPAANMARLSYARALVDAKRYVEARAEFQHLAEAAPQDTDIAYALGLLLLQTNDLDDAQAQFEKLINVQEHRQVAWYYIGQIAETRSDSEAALAAYRRVDRGEHHVNAQLRAAVLMAQNGDVAGARQHLHGLRSRNREDSVRIFRTEAELLARQDQLEDALRVYTDALASFPKETGLLYGRAMLAVQLDMIDRTEADLRDILSREPDNADAINALGYTLADRTQRYDEAYVLIKRAVELKPDDHYVVDSLGWVLFRLGRHEEAIKYLRRAMELKADPEVAAHLGEVLWAAGDQDSAKAVWNTALQAAPDDKRLLEVLKRFGL